MMRNFKSFKGAHSLSFEEDTQPKAVLLSDVKVGDTFMREGAYCMRVQDSVLNQEFKDGVRNENMVVIINLQTANVWPAKGTDEVYFIYAKLVVTKIHKPEC